MNRELVNLCVDTCKGVQTNFTSHQASEVIRKEFVDIFGTDKPNFKDFRDSSKVATAFEVLEEVIDVLVTEGFANNPFFDQFVEYRDLALGDRNEFYVEDKSMLAISEVSGSHWNIRRQKLDVGESFSVKTKFYGAKVYADFLRMVAGRVDFPTLVQKIQKSLVEKMATDIYAQFMGTMQYLPAEFKESGTFVADTAIEIIEHVQASNDNAPVIIAGTKQALRKLTGSYTTTNSFLVSDSMKDSINKTGILTEWNGYQLLEIPQVHKVGTFEFGIAENKLMFLPANCKPIKVVREGESMINQTTSATDNMDMSIEYTFLTNYGIATIFNTYFGMYEII